MQRYDILYEANSPPKVDPNAPPSPPLTAKQKRQQPPLHSHYVQSKVVRALERLESEGKMWAQLDEVANGKVPEQVAEEVVAKEVKEGETVKKTTAEEKKPSP